MRRIIGIDPGLTGAVAILNAEGVIEHVLDTPSFVLSGRARTHDAGGMYSMLFKGGLYLGPADHVFIEEQQMRPHVAVQSTAKVWYGYGLWVGILVATGLPYTPVRAQTWQKEMFNGVTTEGKERSVLEVTRLWPEWAQGQTIRHDRADALMLAEYGRRKLRAGKSDWRELG